MENTKTRTRTKSAALDFVKKADEKRRKVMLKISTAIAMSTVSAATSVAAFASSGTSGSTTDDGEAMFNQVIEFFATWIGRIGLVVGFIGAIMFGLAIKNDDADAKTRGLMTMAAGFVVFAITKSLNLFGISTGVI